MIVSILKNLLTKRFWRPVTQNLLFMMTGAWLLIIYITSRLPPIDLLQNVGNGVQLAWWMLLIAWYATTPRNYEDYKDPSPARSGTTVVLVCGIAAAAFLWGGAAGPQAFIVPGLILLGTTVAAVIVYRFASSHAWEIGEARFDTMATSPQPDS